MKTTILAWLLFFGGFSIEMTIDHLLRIHDGNIRTGGIPELLWFAIQIILASIALWLAYKGTESLITMWKRLLVLGLQAGIGFMLYAFIGLYYVGGTGIDSL